MGNKNKYLSDGDSSDENDSQVDNLEDYMNADERDEAELFNNPYKRSKKGKDQSKNESTFGVFADEYDEKPRFMGLGARKGDRKDISKAPTFVNSHPETHNVVEELNEKEKKSEIEDSGESDHESSSSEEERPKLEKYSDDEQNNYVKKSGFGAKSEPSTSNIFQDSKEPEAESKANRADLSRDDEKHFASISNSFGAKMLAKLGWQAGYGLGTGGKGIAVPIEVNKARPMGAGVGAIKEKTKQQKMEARRRGEIVSDDEEEVKAKRKHEKRTAAQKEEQSKAWKSNKQPRKPKVQHMTYDEIMEQMGAVPNVEPSVGPIIDLTGTQPREVTSSLASHLSTWTPTSESSRIPELRHNLKIIVDESRGQLEGIAKEGRVIQDRRKALLEQEKMIVKTVDTDLLRIERLKKIEEIADSLNNAAKEASILSNPIIDLFTEPILYLISTYPDEYKQYKLDELVIGAITPTVKDLLNDWNPLHDELNWLSEFKKWKKAFIMNETEEEKRQKQLIKSKHDEDFEPIQSNNKDNEQLIMTPYESLIWNCWLPRVRASLINEWNANEPHIAVKIVDNWYPILPKFVFDNVMDQLILPKVQKSVDDWKPSHPKPLHAFIFPWLPFVQDRLSQVLDSSKRKLRSWLKGWQVEEGLPIDLLNWKNVHRGSEWDDLMLRYIVPKLSSHLREDFSINPRNQDMKPLDRVLEWKDTIRLKVFVSIFQQTFFPKWIDILYIWLIQPKPNFDQVAQWYSYWKSYFPEYLHANQKFGDGFKAGLDLMNQAMALGNETSVKLTKPQYGINEVEDKRKTNFEQQHNQREITFFEVAEEFINSKNLMFVPTRTIHSSGLMLYRISDNVDGKGGLTVYVDDDAVWAQDKNTNEFIPMSLEMLVNKTKSLNS